MSFDQSDSFISILKTRLLAPLMYLLGMRCWPAYKVQERDRQLALLLSRATTPPICLECRPNPSRLRPMPFRASLNAPLHELYDAGESGEVRIQAIFKRSIRGKPKATQLCFLRALKHFSAHWTVYNSESDLGILISLHLFFPLFGASWG